MYVVDVIIMIMAMISYQVIITLGASLFKVIIFKNCDYFWCQFIQSYNIYKFYVTLFSNYLQTFDYFFVVLLLYHSKLELIVIFAHFQKKSLDVPNFSNGKERKLK